MTNYFLEVTGLMFYVLFIPAIITYIVLYSSSKFIGFIAMYFLFLACELVFMKLVERVYYET